MAYLHARADGNWTAAATWGVCSEAAAGVLLDSQAGNAVLTTAFVSSAAFTPGAITIDGLAVKVATRAATPTGTISVRLAAGGVAVAGTTVTINVSDIPDDQGAASAQHIGCSVGWVFFKFGASVTLVAATAYALQATTSSATQVNLFRDGTAANWSRMLRTTTTAAPLAGDSAFWGGEWTAAATKTNRTVTINETVATDYGSASLTLASVGVSKGGTIALGSAAATAYVLRVSGNVQFWVESIIDMGVTAALPASSSFRLEFDCLADSDFGIQSYVALNFRGSDPFGTGITQTRLTADAAVAAVSLTVAHNTGWRLGDIIAIAPTQRAVTQVEERPLSVAAGASTLTFATGLANAHAGNAAWETQADVINVTRNFTVATVGTFSTSVYLHGAATGTDCRWACFENCGTGTRTGIDLGTGSYTFTDCSFIRSKDECFGDATTAVTLTLVRCSAFGFGIASAGAFMQMSGTSTHVCVLTSCVLITTGLANSIGVYLGSGATLTMTGCRISGCAETAARLDGPVAATVEDCEIYCQGTGASGPFLVNQNNVGVRIRRTKFWRNSNPPLQITTAYDIDVEECSFYGNSSAGAEVVASTVRFLGCVFASETGFVQNAGLLFGAGTSGVTEIEIHGGDFSTVVNNRIAHTTDISNATTTARFKLLVAGTPLLGATDISATAFLAGSIVAWQRKDDVANVHTWRKYGYGTIAIETGTFGTATPSMKLSPENVARKLETGPMAFPVALGKLITFTARVRKNAAYTGAAPRLLLKANGAIGIDKDTLLATLSVGADTWEVLTGLMPATAQEDGVAAVFVDCDGTAGDVFVDDFTAVST